MKLFTCTCEYCMEIPFCVLFNNELFFMNLKSFWFIFFIGFLRPLKILRKIFYKFFKSFWVLWNLLYYFTLKIFDFRDKLKSIKEKFKLYRFKKEHNPESSSAYKPSQKTSTKNIIFTPHWIEYQVVIEPLFEIVTNTVHTFVRTFKTTLELLSWKKNNILQILVIDFGKN